MKANAKHLTASGNLALVQLEVLPLSQFPFRPGAPEIRSGGLTVTEAETSGIVGKLLAYNHTDSALLLTDADILIGAKQNRVLNRSVLLMPGSKTILDVSCVERRRWNYTTREFSPGKTVADPALRKEKARSVAFRITNAANSEENTQQKVWEHIRLSMEEEGCNSVTESYADLLQCRADDLYPGFPGCVPEPGCNALAVIVNGSVESIDIFGNEETYRYYFRQLKETAVQRHFGDHYDRVVGQDEAFFKSLDLLDRFEELPSLPDPSYTAGGQMFVTGDVTLTGISLLQSGEVVHRVIFSGGNE